MIWGILINMVTTVIATCNISINQDLPNKQPLLIQTRNAKANFVSPANATDQIILNQNEIIEAYCPGSITLVNGLSTNKNSIQLRCFRATFFRYKQKTVNLYQVTCSKPPRDVAHYTRRKCCAENQEFEIGFPYNTTFLTLITGCFNKGTQSTLYTIHTIVRSISGRLLSNPRRYWQKGLSFFHLVNVNNLYTRNDQRLFINNLLGLDKNSTEYISADNYLSKGHLVPRADFLFGTQQNATFYLANAIPQWCHLNKGNWKKLEYELRKLAAERNKDLKVYTGTYEILRLPHKSTGKLVDLYLTRQHGMYGVAIPEYIWKIAYDENSKAAVAFIGVNNPYLKKNLSAYRICEDICRQLGYIKWNRDYLKHGYVYCCEVNDLRRRVQTVPRFVVKKLLI